LKIGICNFVCHKNSATPKYEERLVKPFVIIGQFFKGG
jgi:hypothetical protein